MRVRRNLSLNTEDERHRRADELLSRQQKPTEYIVTAILAYEDAVTKKDLDEAVQSIIDRLAGITVVKESREEEKKKINKDILDFIDF